MKEEIIKWETAKLANNKHCYLFNGNLAGFTMDKPKCINLITQSLLQKWLREKHNIDITIITNWNKEIKSYRVGLSYILNNKIEIWFSRKDTEILEYKTYEEALEIGLYQGLKLVL